jgi:hypothetical protein
MARERMLGASTSYFVGVFVPCEIRAERNIDGQRRKVRGESKVCTVLYRRPLEGAGSREHSHDATSTMNGKRKQHGQIISK